MELRAARADYDGTLLDWMRCCSVRNDTAMFVDAGIALDVA